MSTSRPPQAEKNICAHEICDCSVAEESKYCSPECAEVHADGNVVESCPCPCKSCAGK